MHDCYAGPMALTQVMGLGKETMAGLNSV